MAGYDNLVYTVRLLQVGRLVQTGRLTQAGRLVQALVGWFILLDRCR